MCSCHVPNIFYFNYNDLSTLPSKTVFLFSNASTLSDSIYTVDKVILNSFPSLFPVSSFLSFYQVLMQLRLPSMQLRLALNSCFSLLLPRAGIIGMQQHTRPSKLSFFVIFLDFYYLQKLSAVSKVKHSPSKIIPSVEKVPVFYLPSPNFYVLYSLYNPGLIHSIPLQL